MISAQKCLFKATGLFLVIVSSEILMSLHLHLCLRYLPPTVDSCQTTGMFTVSKSCREGHVVKEPHADRTHPAPWTSCHYFHLTMIWAQSCLMCRLCFSPSAAWKKRHVLLLIPSPLLLCFLLLNTPPWLWFITTLAYPLLMLPVLTIIPWWWYLS